MKEKQRLKLNKQKDEWAEKELDRLITQVSTAPKAVFTSDPHPLVEFARELHFLLQRFVQRALLNRRCSARSSKNQYKQNPTKDLINKRKLIIKNNELETKLILINLKILHNISNDKNIKKQHKNLNTTILRLNKYYLNKLKN